MAMILVVDDDAMTLKLLEHTLTAGGHEVVATANSQEAALLAAAHQVDAVILDVIMPGRSGFEVLEDLHVNPDTKKLPVLMLSSLGEAEDRVKGLRGGADEYIGKPFDPEELLLRLNRLIDGRWAEKPEFEGNLETLPFSEVIQSLAHSATHGVLEVGREDRRGTLTVNGGNPTEATWGNLEGIEAVLAMMDVKSGTFRFHEQAPRVATAADATEIEIQKVMFTAAWLVDELSRWPEVRSDAPLSIRQGAESPASPAEWTSMPVEAVFDDIRCNSGISLQGLEATERWSPKKTTLAVRFLVQSGYVDVGVEDGAGENLFGLGEETCASAVDAVIKAVE
ncbi:MAG: response regulator, partial [Acidobacteriota bacterium]